MDRLLVTDLDGTLLRSDLSLSPYSVGVVAGALGAGFPLTYATARSRQSSAPLLGSLPFALPAIIYNGAFVIDPATGEPFVRNLLDGAVAAEVVADGERRGTSAFVFGFERGREVLLHKAPENHGQEDFIETRRRRGDPRLTRVEGIVAPREVIEVQFTAPFDELTELAAWARREFAGAVSVALSRDIYAEGFYHLEISHARANKKDMLAWVAAEVCVDLKNVTVFGDGHNDLPMFEIAGRRVAVGNAHPEVLAHADHVIAPNDEDGVAHFIESLLSSGK